MPLRPRIWLLRIFGFAAVCLFAAGGESTLATPLNAWEHRCISDDDSNEKVCATEFHTRFEERDFVFYFARGPAGPVPFVAQSDDAPFRRMTVKVDDEPDIDADRCEVGFCYFGAEKSRKLINLFRKGLKALVVIEGPGKNRLFDAPITLSGFSSAYKRYR